MTTPGWQEIATIDDPQRVVLLWTPASALYERPKGRPDDIRVAAPQFWTWATHWMPLPDPPSVLLPPQEPAQTRTARESLGTMESIGPQMPNVESVVPETPRDELCEAVESYEVDMLRENNEKLRADLAAAPTEESITKEDV